MREVKQSLCLAGLPNLFQICRQRGPAIRHDELFEIVVRHLLDGSSQRLSTMCVDGQQRSAQVMGANHTERTLNELTIASLALTQRGFSSALRRYIDAGSNDERHLTLRIGQCGSRPGDAAHTAVAIEPLILVGRGKMTRTKTLKRLDRLRNLLAWNELVPRIAADQGREVIARSHLAGAVEANDAASRIEDSDQSSHRIEHGRNEVALHRKSGLNTLSRTRGAIHLTNTTVEFESGDHLATENAQCRSLLLAESSRVMIEYEQRTNADAARSRKRRTRVEAVRPAFKDDSIGSVVGVVACIRNLVNCVAEDGGLAGQTAERNIE